jgi:hypothetical protein
MTFRNKPSMLKLEGWLPVITLELQNKEMQRLIVRVRSDYQRIVAGKSSSEKHKDVFAVQRWTLVFPESVDGPKSYGNNRDGEIRPALFMARRTVRVGSRINIPCPQTFRMDRMSLGREISAGGLIWRAIEYNILGNAAPHFSRESEREISEKTDASSPMEMSDLINSSEEASTLK